MGFLRKAFAAAASAPRLPLSSGATLKSLPAGGGSALDVVLEFLGVFLQKTAVVGLWRGPNFTRNLVSGCDGVLVGEEASFWLGRDIHNQSFTYVDFN